MALLVSRRSARCVAAVTTMAVRAGRPPSSNPLATLHLRTLSSSSAVSQFPLTFIHPTAKVSGCCGSLVLGASTTHVYAGRQIGARCEIGPFAYVGEGVEVGDDTVVGTGATLLHCALGRGVVLHAGVRIGQDGFGFQLAASGAHAKKPQELRVEVHDYVEIGWELRGGR